MNAELFKAVCATLGTKEAVMAEFPASESGKALMELRHYTRKAGLQFRYKRSTVAGSPMEEFALWVEPLAPPERSMLP